MIILIKLAVILFVCWATPVFAGTYWVSPTGSASWANCQSATDPGSNYCALNTANTNVVAGDTVYLKGGTYTESRAYEGAIHPHNTGTGSGTGRIIFTAAPGESASTVVITRSVTMYGFWLGQERTNNWIKIDNITFTGSWVFTGYITNSSSYNEISNCVFNGVGGGGFWMFPSCLGSSNYNCNVTHNWIHHNTFNQGGKAYSACEEGGDLIRLGPACCPSNTSAEDNYNTLENNTMAYGGHGTIDAFGRFTVFKNNVLHNEPWNTSNAGSCIYPNTSGYYTDSSYTGKYGHRNAQFNDDFIRPALYNLIEGNRFGYASVNPNNGGADNLDISGPKQIVRYNLFYGAMNAGIRFKYGSGVPGTPGTGGGGGWGGVYNRVFNNTMYHNGYGYPFYETCQNNTCPHEEGGIIAECYSGSFGTFGNIAKNNLLYDNRSYYNYGTDIINRGGTFDSTCLERTNNWLTSNGNPSFTNPSLANTSSLTLPDLTLQSSSGAIDGGTYLTTANGAGSASTTLIVHDALYFQDGTWGSALARGVTLFPDWIAIGGVSNVVQISSINYSTNTITLASPMTWSNGANIWLYKKSDGTRVLYGSRPDYGAYEYSSTSQIGAPTKLFIIR